MHHIKVSYDYGQAEGYVLEPEDLESYFLKHTSSFEKLRRKIPDLTLALLQSVSVDGEFQGRGYGKNLVFDFEERAEDFGACAIILIADSTEQQRARFDLGKFYRLLGYKKIGKTSTGEVMIKYL